MEAVCHLGFQEFEIVTASIARRCSVRHRAKFRGYQSHQCRDMATSLFLRWLPSAILDFKRFQNLTADLVAILCH